MDELYSNSSAEQFGIIREEFVAILREISSKFLPADATPGDTRELYEGLKLKELVLARACAAGNERAWETFLIRYREKLYDIAGGIARESSAARELADEIYAELYGTVTREGVRVCKLASYTGRGSLEGWLRTVMAQAFINKYRRQRRLVSLDEESESGAQFPTKESEQTPVVDLRLQAATDEVLAALSPEDRFLLASYYLDGQTLAQIARTLSIHESTVSRKLDKLAKSLRKQILAALGHRGMSRAQAQEALEVDVRDLSLNIRDRLTQKDNLRAFPDKKAQAGAGESSD
jgi:RNA polymerase sigma-70 factor, ECF subfamily